MFEEITDDKINIKSYYNIVMTSKIPKMLIETILSKAAISADFTGCQVEEKGATTVMWGGPLPLKA